MLDEMVVHIIGLGLMGGSLAMDLRGQVAAITAQDRDSDVLEAAIAQQVIDRVGLPHEADIVVLAVPAHTIIEMLPTLTIKPGALVIDLGSTKQVICAEMDRLPDGIRAVGGHPLCGIAENGFQNAHSGLYVGARFVLCETRHTNDAARTISENVVRAIKAHPVWMSAEAHDRRVGLTSHVPHLLSAALMGLAQTISADDSETLSLAAGGFDGATRLMRTDAAMITGMLTTNQAVVRELTAALQDQLDDLTALLDDPSALQNVLEELVAKRRTLQRRDLR